MIEEGIPNSVYHAHEAISSSDVKAVASTSLLHWKNKVYKRSAAFDLGTAVHALVLEPEKSLVVRGPEDRRGRKWKEKQAEADLTGQLLLTESDFDKAAAMALAIINSPIGPTLVGDDTINEASIFATDSATGLPIKTRPDSYWPDRGIVYDVKTTQDASPVGFAREIQKYNYALQAAFYLHVMRCAGLKAKKFVFVAVEKEPPFAVGIHMLTDEYIIWAERQMHTVLAQIKEAQATSTFTTGWPAVNIVDLPRWMSADADEDFN